MTNGDWQPLSQVPPPTEFSGMPETPSKWPTVIGTISIILGALGLVCYGCGTLNTAGSSSFSSMLPEDQRPPPVPAAQLAVQITQMCVTWLLSAWLLAAGIGLVKRRRWARPHHLGWAVAKIVVAVVGTAISFIFIQDSVRQINDAMSQQGPPPFTVTEELVTVVMIAVMIWFLIYPIFLLLWFSRRKIKAEVAAWL